MFTCGRHKCKEDLPEEADEVAHVAEAAGHLLLLIVVIKLTFVGCKCLFASGKGIYGK